MSEIVVLLRTAPDIYGEATPFRQLMIKASASELRDAIRECLLTPSSASVNRRRMGLLASVLLERMNDAYSDKYAAERRALDAEEEARRLWQTVVALRVKEEQSGSPGTPAAETPPAKPKKPAAGKRQR